MRFVEVLRGPSCGPDAVAPGGSGEESPRRDEATRYARQHGHVIVGQAADTDESGSLPPAERPGLAAWLTDPGRVVQFDGLLACDLDVLGRCATDLSDLYAWALHNAKQIIIIQPQIRWPVSHDDPASSAVWHMIRHIAENEGYVIAKRSREMRTMAPQSGREFGKPPFGYREEVARAKIRMVPDDEAIRIVQETIRHHTEGWSIPRICEWLESEGVHKHTMPRRLCGGRGGSAQAEQASA